MQFIAPVLEFLKKHYEKIILCVVLLALAAAAIWMGEAIAKEKDTLSQPLPGKPANAKPLAPLDLTTDLLALAEVTNPPPVVLSGDHNLFNPVTWKRRANGEWMKVLKTGPDALDIISNIPLYTVIAYDHPSPNGDVYIMAIQEHSMKRPSDYAKVNEKPKSGLYVIKGIKGASDNPDALQLEIPDTGEAVTVSKGNPYKRVDGYLVDLKYEPEAHVMNRVHVNDTISLDNEQYKVVDITNNFIRVEYIKTGKITTIKYSGAP